MIENKQRLIYKLLQIFDNIENPLVQLDTQDEYKEYINNKANMRDVFISIEDVLKLDGFELGDDTIVGLWVILDDIIDSYKIIEDSKHFVIDVLKLCSKRFNFMNAIQIELLYKTYGKVNK